MTTPTVPDWAKAPIEWYRWARDVERRVEASRVASETDVGPTIVATQEDPAIYTDAAPDTTRKTLLLSAPYVWSVYQIITKSRQGTAELVLYVNDDLVGTATIAQLKSTVDVAFDVPLGARLDIQITNVVGGLEGVVVQFSATRALAEA